MADIQLGDPVIDLANGRAMIVLDRWSTAPGPFFASA